MKGQWAQLTFLETCKVTILHTFSVFTGPIIIWCTIWIVRSVSLLEIPQRRLAIHLTLILKKVRRNKAPLFQNFLSEKSVKNRKPNFETSSHHYVQSICNTYWNKQENNIIFAILFVWYMSESQKLILQLCAKPHKGDPQESSASSDFRPTSQMQNYFTHCIWNIWFPVTKALLCC